MKNVSFALLPFVFISFWLSNQISTFVVPHKAPGKAGVHMDGKSTNVIYVDGVEHPSIASALASCPLSGCVVVDESQGSVSTAANPFAGITAPFVIHLGAATYQTTAQWQLAHSNQIVIGRGVNATSVVAADGFPNNQDGGSGCTAQIGQAGGDYVDNTRFEELTIQGHLSDPHSCSLYSTNLNEGSGARDVGLVNFNQYGIHFKGSNTGDFMIEHINGNPAPSASNSSMVFLDHTGDKSFVTDITCGNGSGSPQAACIDLSYAQNFAQQVHCENYIDCVKFEAGSWGAAINIVGLQASSVTNAVHIMRGAGAVFVASASNGTGNTLINNTTGFSTTNGDILTNYSFGGSSAGGECYQSQLSTGLRCTGPFRAKSFATSSNCITTTIPAECGVAPAGSVTVGPGKTATMVKTKAVSDKSQILVTFDASLGKALGVNCNPNVAPPTISSRTAGSSFMITTPVAPTGLPACYSYIVIN